MKYLNQELVIAIDRVSEDGILIMHVALRLICRMVYFVFSISSIGSCCGALYTAFDGVCHELHSL